MPDAFKPLNNAAGVITPTPLRMSFGYVSNALTYHTGGKREVSQCRNMLLPPPVSLKLPTSHLVTHASHHLTSYASCDSFTFRSCIDCTGTSWETDGGSRIA